MEVKILTNLYPCLIRFSYVPNKIINYRWNNKSNLNIYIPTLENIGNSDMAAFRFICIFLNLFGRLRTTMLYEVDSQFGSQAKISITNLDFCRRSGSLYAILY